MNSKLLRILSWVLLGTFGVVTTFYLKEGIQEKRKQDKKVRLEKQRAFLTPTYKKITFGASVGDPIAIVGYPGVTEAAVKKGIVNIRFFEPFMKSVDTNVAYLSERIKYLVDKGVNNVTITLSNNAYSQLKHDTVGKVYTQKQRETFPYTNRNFPSDTVKYIKLLNRLCEQLTVIKKYNGIPLIKLCTFELNGEINADRYFLGTLDQAIRWNRIKYGVLKKYVPDSVIYGGSCTASLISDSTGRKGDYLKYFLTDTLFNRIGFSHSFYWEHSKGMSFNVNDNNYPNRAYRDIYITEYNIYTSFTKGSLRDTLFRSPYYIVKLVELLTFIYDKPVSKINIHTLCNIAGNDTKNLLGLVDKVFHQPTHSSYYVFNPNLQRLYDVIAVIKDGYYPIPGGIQGKYKRIMISGYDYQILNN